MLYVDNSIVICDVFDCFLICVLFQQKFAPRTAIDFKWEEPVQRNDDLPTNNAVLPVQK
jgi:hypothetical protein